MADIGLPDFVNHLIPLVEASLQTPVSNTFSSGTVTTGTINPGVIWVGDKFQVGVEAMIPVNRQSGSNVGAIGQIHFFLDDIFPIHRPADFRQRHRIREAGLREQAMRHLGKIAIAFIVILISAACPRACHARPRQPEGRQHGRHAPKELPLWFTEKLEPAFSTAKCAMRKAWRCKAARRMSTAATAPNCGAAQGAAAGDLSVTWRVLSVDTHRTQGSFTFKVGP